MKKILTIILLCLLTLAVSAQTPDERRIMQHVATATKAMKTMQTDFVQTKHTKMLGEKMVIKGKMYYSQPNRLRCEYLSPYQYVFTLNGQQVMVRKGNKTNVMDVQKSKMFREVTRLMLSTMTGTYLSDTKDFTVSATSQGDAYVITLVPVRKDMKRMYSKLVLTFLKKEERVSKIVMHEKNGDRLEIVMQGTVLNKKLSDTLFSLK